MRLKWLMLCFVVLLAGCAASSPSADNQQQVTNSAEEKGSDKDKDGSVNEISSVADSEGIESAFGTDSNGSDPADDALQQESHSEALTESAKESEPESTIEPEPESIEAQSAEEVEFDKKRELPEGFVYVDEVLEHALYDIRYYGEYNFVGEQIDGYNAPFAILSEKAAAALKKVEQAMEPLGYVLLIYDAYRPQKAVAHFGRWAKDEQDERMKEQFYPDVDKSDVFELGFLARRSGHSRGSTVDLTLADKETGESLDMGGPYDFFGDISAHEAAGLTKEQSELRLLLKETMVAAGFEPYRKEWWHYTLKNEPYPKKYFDFDVE
ncbi:hypothetical protein J40TS1_28330 [Paenibacillus montaniterrae]|uniref:D-alanyl-D-alanine dipeptidase n=1 Tax=Paenibacillus montaniterrae TaxID=429341 RepID=A0A919YRS9_9BACL|nr:M15 family metallopeptidase [Paenibacillus montaniterrae]GIP17191.1 hypothetical protein J40TS1_28330 [Paenibacillus montaniterrae]